jgi:hypothetical protein
MSSRLIATAESLLDKLGYYWADLGGEKTTPGQSVHMVADEWIMRKRLAVN